jgi:hypothetical protein
MANPEPPPPGSQGPTGPPPVPPADPAEKASADTELPGITKPSSPETPAPTQGSPPAAIPAIAAVPTAPKRRLQWNLILFFLVVASATFWFARHIQYWFAAVTSGSLVALVTVAQAVYGAIKWSLEEELKTWPKRLLGQLWLRPGLVILLGLTGGLNLVTSSLYIQYAGAESDVQKCTVEVVDTSTNQRFIEPITINSTYQTAGHRFFFRFRPTTLRFDLNEPRGHAPRTENFGWFSAILLRAPVDFAPKEFRLLRIVFGPRLWRNLAEIGETVETPYDLDVSIGGKHTQIPDVRRQTIIVGAAKADIEYALKHEDPAAKNSAFVDHLSAWGFLPEQQKQWISQWEDKRLIVATDEHSPDEPIDLTLVRRGEAPLVREQTQKTISYPVQTLFLDLP